MRRIVQNILFWVHINIVCRSFAHQTHFTDVFAWYRNKFGPPDACIAITNENVRNTCFRFYNIEILISSYYKLLELLDRQKYVASSGYHAPMEVCSGKGAHVAWVANGGRWYSKGRKRYRRKMCESWILLSIPANDSQTEEKKNT